MIFINCSNISFSIILDCWEFSSFLDPKTNSFFLFKKIFPSHPRLTLSPTYTGDLPEFIVHSQIYSSINKNLNRRCPPIRYCPNDGRVPHIHKWIQMYKTFFLVWHLWLFCELKSTTPSSFHVPQTYFDVIKHLLTFKVFIIRKQFIPFTPSRFLRLDQFLVYLRAFEPQYPCRSLQRNEVECS